MKSLKKKKRCQSGWVLAEPNPEGRPGRAHPGNRGARREPSCVLLRLDSFASQPTKTEKPGGAGVGPSGCTGGGLVERKKCDEMEHTSSGRQVKGFACSFIFPKSRPVPVLL